MNLYKLTSKIVKNKKNAFTFVELIIVTTIIVILTWIWFSSYVQYIWDSRDSQRKSDLSHISSALKIYKQKRWYYPMPWYNFNLTYSWTIVANQWLLNKNVHLDTLEKLPIDPKALIPYFYSIITNKQEFQIAWTLENDEYEISILNWSYKTVSKNNLPTILLSTWATIWSNVEVQSGTIQWDINRKLFIYDNQTHNLPYNFTNPYDPINDWTSFDDLLNDMEQTDDFWQNSDFRNCIEIEEWWKLLLTETWTTVEYQIVTDTWALVSTWCTL